MKAIVQDRYGPLELLELRDVDRPKVGENEVLVRVRAASVHADIWHCVTGLPYLLRFIGSGIFKPKHKIPGTDLSGQVESVGKNVTEFAAGDDVFGECRNGHQWINGGAYAEFASVRSSALAHKPANVTFEQAAAVPNSGVIAFQGLREEGRIGAGQKVLINGAGGGVGALAVQIAKSYGAHVTGVDDTKKQDLLRTLGADHVIDYTKVDFTREAERYDLILDVASTLSLKEARRALTARGTYVIIGHDHFGKVGRRWFGSLPHMFKLSFLSLFVRHLRSKGSKGDTRPPTVILRELLEAGKLTPVIDRTYPLRQVKQALRYLVNGQPQGKVILSP